jgi:hypothetical protein
LAVKFEARADAPEVHRGGLQRLFDGVPRLPQSSPFIYDFCGIFSRGLFIRSPNSQIIGHIADPSSHSFLVYLKIDWPRKCFPGKYGLKGIHLNKLEGGFRVVRP